MPTLTKSEEVIALEEALAFKNAHPNYFPCKENLVILNNYLEMHNLAPTYPNLKRAYEVLTETGQLHLSTPDPRPLGGSAILPKPTIQRYTGSKYDRTEINRLKAEIAVMDSRQLKEFLAVNQWDDFPLWLKA